MAGNNGKNRIAITPILSWGWLLPSLLDIDRRLYGRWDYWTTCLTAGRLPATPIPKVDWLMSPQSPARKMLEKSLDAVPSYGSWQTWGGWSYFDYFLDWLLYGFGYPGQPELPVEPSDCTGASGRLCQIFNLEMLLDYPYDYFGDILAENHHGRAQGFYPTPFNVVKLMTTMLFTGEGDYRVQTVLDPCLGTGRILLLAGDYSLRLYGQDISQTVIKAALVNGYCYVPWLVKPIPWLDAAQYDPTRSAELSEAMTVTGNNGRPDVTAYLNQTEHDTAQQWRFEPIKKRRKNGQPEEAVALQGVLF